MSALEPVQRISIATFQRSKSDQIRVELYRLPDGRWRAGLRIWFATSGGEFKPSREGVAIPAELLPQVAGALTDAVREARDRSILE